MVPVDWMLSFILGLLLPHAGTHIVLERWSEEPIQEARVALLLWAGLVFAPASAFILHWQTAWGLMYLFDPEIHRFWSGLAFWVSGFLIVFGAYGGFALSWRWLKEGRRKTGLRWSAVSLLIMAAFAVLNARRGLLVGTYDQWQQGAAQSFFKHSLFPANIILIAVVVGSYFRIFFRLCRESHAERPASLAAGRPASLAAGPPPPAAPAAGG